MPSDLLVTGDLRALHTAAPSERPRRRRQANRRTVDAVMAATRALVLELGYENLTFDLLARRSEVAKTTLYRWWPTKAELVLSLLERDIAARALPTTLEGRLEVLFGPAGFPGFATLLAALALDLGSDLSQRRRLHQLLTNATGPVRAREADEPVTGDETLLIETYCGRQLFRALLGEPTSARPAPHQLVDGPR